MKLKAKSGIWDYKDLLEPVRTGKVVVEKKSIIKNAIKTTTSLIAEIEDKIEKLQDRTKSLSSIQSQIKKLILPIDKEKPKEETAVESKLKTIQSAITEVQNKVKVLWDKIKASLPSF